MDINSNCGKTSNLGILNADFTIQNKSSRYFTTENFVNYPQNIVFKAFVCVPKSSSYSLVIACDNNEY
jgi:hypothetical protein